MTPPAFEYQSSLESLGQHLSATPSVRNNVMADILRDPHFHSRRRLLLPMSLAAGILLALTLGSLFYFLPTSTPAFADVVRQITQARTLSFTRETQQLGQAQPYVVKVFLLQPTGMREEHPDGKIYIYDLSTGNGVCLDSITKIARPVGESGATANINQIESFYDHLLKFHPKSLGRRTIDGVSADGFIADEKQVTITIWADAVTHHTLQLDVDYKTPTIGHANYSHYNFDPPLDPSLFNLVPPDGYTTQFIGDPPAAASKPASVAHSDTRSAALTSLRDHPSLQSLHELLRLNGRKPNEAARLISPNAFFGSKDPAPLFVHSQGHDFIIAAARTNLDSQALYLFDPAGNLLTRLGGDTPGGEAHLMNLGSKQTQFAWIFYKDSRQSPHYRSDIYALSGSLSQPALSLTHPANAMAFTSPDSLVNHQVGLLPYLPSAHSTFPASATGQDGQPHPAFLIWNETDSVFQGSSLMRFTPDHVYTVNLQRSTGFRATDLPAATTQPAPAIIPAKP